MRRLVLLLGVMVGMAASQGAMAAPVLGGQVMASHSSVTQVYYYHGRYYPYYYHGHYYRHRYYRHGRPYYY